MHILYLNWVSTVLGYGLLLFVTMLSSRPVLNKYNLNPVEQLQWNMNPDYTLRIINALNLEFTKYQ